jgi:hypothetical protein
LLDLLDELRAHALERVHAAPVAPLAMVALSGRASFTGRFAYLDHNHAPRVLDLGEPACCEVCMNALRDRVRLHRASMVGVFCSSQELD